MTVLVVFLLAVFLVAARGEAHGRAPRFRWLFVCTFVVAASFYSLRVIS